MNLRRSEAAVRVFSRLLTAAVIAGVALFTVSAAGSTAQTAAPAAPTDVQPSLVEDYTYPGADQILATYGVVLISGDGHLLFDDCTTPPTGSIGLIKVYTTEFIGPNKKGLVCFRVLGSAGSLNVKVPGVYEIRGDGLTAGAGHKLKAEVTTDAGAHTIVDCNPSGSTPVGIGASPNNPPTTLLTLTATT
jgi:hypothetical protein